MTRKLLTVSDNVGTELVSKSTNHVTGFSVAVFNKKKVYEDPLAKYYYILIVLKGSIKLSCKYFQNKSIQENMMSFLPKDSRFVFTAEPNSMVMFFAFSTTILRTKQEILDYFCAHARKFEYTFKPLGLSPEMQQVVHLIRDQLLSRKIKNGDICDAWNTLFFHTLQTFYSKDEIISFVRPIIDAVVDFHAFIENNYRTSGGNVKSLIALSGIPYARFHKLFNNTYGMSAKAWLDMRARNRIIDMAGTPKITVTDMALPFKMSTQQFCSLCRRLTGCTPTELIAREQNKAEMDAEEEGANEYVEY